MPFDCDFWGCNYGGPDPNDNCCTRCGAHPSEGQFVDAPSPVGRRLLALRDRWRMFWQPGHCFQCGRRTWPWFRTPDRLFCSRKCCDEYIPF